jgi:hypothetical protein
MFEKAPKKESKELSEEDKKFKDKQKAEAKVIIAIIITVIACTPSHGDVLSNAMLMCMVTWCRQ